MIPPLKRLSPGHKKKIMALGLILTMSLFPQMKDNTGRESLLAETPEESPRSDNAYRKGMDAYTRKDYTGALPHFDAALRKDPKNHVLHYRSGFARLKMILRTKHYDRKKALKQLPLAERNYIEAITLANTLLKAGPDSRELREFLSGAWNNLGVLYDLNWELRGDVRFASKSEQCYQNAIKLNPPANAAYYNLSIVYADRHMAHKAVTLFQNARGNRLELKYQKTGTYVLGVRSFEQGRYRDTIHYLRETLSLGPNPHQKQIYNYLARSYYFDGADHYINQRYQSAMDQLEKALQYDKNYATAMIYAMLGDCYWMRTGRRHAPADMQQALKYYTMAIKKRYPGKTIFFSRGQVYMKLGQYGKGQADFKTYGVQDTGVCFWMGYMHDSQGQYAKALDFYSRSIEKDPKRDEAFFNRGMIHMNHRKDYRKARTDFIASLLIKLKTNSESRAERVIDRVLKTRTRSEREKLRITLGLDESGFDAVCLAAAQVRICDERLKNKPDPHHAEAALP